VLLTKVVVRFAELPERFHTTTSLATKFDPVTVKATSGAAIVAVVGEIEAIEGIGGGGGCTGAELPPPQPPRLISSTNKDRVNPQAFCMPLLLILPRWASCFLPSFHRSVLFRSSFVTMLTIRNIDTGLFQNIDTDRRLACVVGFHD
jgi:hypothetical protein